MHLDEKNRFLQIAPYFWDSVTDIELKSKMNEGRKDTEIAPRIGAMTPTQKQQKFLKKGLGFQKTQCIGPLSFQKIMVNPF